MKELARIVQLVMSQSTLVVANGNRACRRLSAGRRVICMLHGAGLAHTPAA